LGLKRPPTWPNCGAGSAPGLNFWGKGPRPPELTKPKNISKREKTVVVVSKG